jgi:hypothetical protein
MQEDFMKIALLIAVFSVLALADLSTQQIETTGTIPSPYLVSMGPDPGGHTGATVTPETSKTGQPAVDSARQAASGSSTEKIAPPADTSQQAKKP